MTVPRHSSALPVESSIADLLLARKADQGVGLIYEDRSWTWEEYVHEAGRRAAWLRGRWGDGPIHVGVMLENVPEYAFWLGACALSRATIVGLNRTRRGAELERDIRHTDCALIIHEHGLDLGDGLADIPLVDVTGTEYLSALDDVELKLEGFPASPDDLFALVFTSGTTSAPKAVRCTHQRIAGQALFTSERVGVTRSDVLYVAMPLFHSNAMILGWGVALATGAPAVLKRRFSASDFLNDVRRYGVMALNPVRRKATFVHSGNPSASE